MTQIEPLKRHRIRNYLLGLVATILVLVLALVVVLVVVVKSNEAKTGRQQAKLAPFYRPPAGFAATPLGTVLRKQRVGVVPDGATGWRVLYRSELADGTPSVSGGLVFAPKGAAPPGGRPVVAWAHGTLGMGDACAPSRSWGSGRAGVPGLALFLARGWDVVATDYTGLGTPGVEQYLVGGAEARDVLNGVRAARTMGIDASTRVALWGHSQGGHSVLWTAALAPGLAPELQIVAAAAAAPAAELPLLVDLQWEKVIGSLIGTEVLVSWPATYPDVHARSVATGDLNARDVANQCIGAGLVDLAIRNLFGQQAFRINPISVPAWRTAAEANIAPLPVAGLPTLIAQGLKDPVVLPPTTVTYTDLACAAGADLTSVWIGDLGHMTAGKAAAPIVATWLQQRFAGLSTSSTCSTVPPVAPAVPLR